MSPSVALNGRNYATIREKLNPNYVSDVSPHTKLIPKYNIGDSVLALNVREGRKWLNATIVNVLGENVYEAHIHDLNVIWKRHTHQLLPLSPETLPVPASQSVPVAI